MATALLYRPDLSTLVKGENNRRTQVLAGVVLRIYHFSAWVNGSCVRVPLKVWGELLFQ